jgi:hypothetical protein
MKPIKVIHKIYCDEPLSVLKKQIPDVSHVKIIINYEAFVYSAGKLIAIYKKACFDSLAARKASIQLRFDKQVRSSGIVSMSINLNASPRRPHLDNRCWQSKLKRTNPDIHEVYEQIAQEISKVYRQYFKKRFANQVKQTYSGLNKVDSAYRIKNTPFTGGVINKDSALPYHYDMANTDDGISCMLILRHGIGGGELILPQLNLGFACQDDYILLFDGKNYLHGVTPIVKRPNSNAYRYTIVNYNNSGMDICLPPNEEDLHYQAHLEKQSETKRNRKK